MNVRIATMLAAVVPIAALGFLGSEVSVPYVALQPGPTYNTLGKVEIKKDVEKPVVDIEGDVVDPNPPGNLNMTTVSVRSKLSIFEALAYWLDGSSGIVPRSEVYPPGQSKDQIDKSNQAEFKQSENSAELAAARYLGYSIQVSVGEVATDGPAAGKLEQGDKIVEIAGQPIDSAHAATEIIGSHKPDSKLSITVKRNGVDTKVEVVIGARPDDKSRGYLGIGLSEDADVPFTITFNLADIGGPSAGLMFTLAVIDKLTPGPLNDGKFIAGTGTIDSVGAVGPIGGIRYKMEAAKDAGAQYFLVPAENCKEATANAPDGLKLVKVTRLADAVDSLKSLSSGGKNLPAC